MLAATTSGLLTGLGLIVAIGAQNAFVLRTGLTRRHVGAVVAVCALSDVVLIVAGVGGIGAVVEHAGWVVEAFRWAGVAFLSWYGVSALRRARHATSLQAAREDAASRRRTVGTALALTWLNPHVYLDTVLLLGSVANTQPHGGRWWFALGASAASILWFTGLGYGARAAHGLLARPSAWRVLDVVVGVVMLAIAGTLVAGSEVWA